MQGNSSPPPGEHYEKSRALVIGNGESRSWFKPCHQSILDSNVITWGCNAIYREGKNCVHNLVSVDYGMQQEIYDSGYAFDHTCFFVDWQRLPSAVGETFLMGFDIPKEFVFYSEGDAYGHSECVIRGKDPATVQEKVKEALEKFPHLDKSDLIQKMEKDTGVWITWVKENDEVIHFDFPRGWSTGCSAMHLACQNGSREVYFLGFDLSEYETLSSFDLIANKDSIA